MEKASTSSLNCEVYNSTESHQQRYGVMHLPSKKSNYSVNKKRKNELSVNCNKKIKFSNYSKKRSSFTMDTVPEHHFHLGGLKFVVVSSFSNVVRIHLRQYKQDDDGYVLPTKTGVTFTPFIWKSINFDSVSVPSRTEENITIRDAMMISTELIENETFVSIQRYFKRRDHSRCFFPSAMLLHEREWGCLVAFEQEINNSVISAMFGGIFHRHILEHARNCVSANIFDNATDAEMTLTTSMIEILQNYLGTSINNIMECQGCALDLGNQLGHECVTSTHADKLRRYGDLALFNMDFKTLAKDFVEENISMVNFITMSFLEKLNFKQLLQNAKDLYIASDPDPDRLF